MMQAYRVNILLQPIEKQDGTITSSIETFAQNDY